MLQRGFPGGSVGKESACSAGDGSRWKFNPRAAKIPWRRAWQPTAVFLPGESHGQRSLVGYSPRVSKSRTLLKWLNTHTNTHTHTHTLQGWASLVAHMVKNLITMREITIWIPQPERFPGEGNGYSPQNSCLENSMLPSDMTERPTHICYKDTLYITETIANVL